MGVTLNRQVQRRISRMQVAVSERPVGHPGDRHLPEHRPQHAAMIVFNPTAGHLIVTDHRLQTLLTDRAEREMVIKQPAQQLPAVTVKALLQPRVIHASRIGPVHEADQRLELLTASSEPTHHRLAALTAGVAIPSDCTITTTAPERQDFTHRRVKFNSTGVEIGGHVRPPFVVDQGQEQRRLRHPLYDSSAASRAPTTAPPNPAEHPKPPASASPDAINRPTSTTPPPRRGARPHGQQSEISRIYRGIPVSPDRPQVTSGEPHPSAAWRHQQGRGRTRRPRDRPR
jgi:hypothetical protein